MKYCLIILAIALSWSQASLANKPKKPFEVIAYYTGSADSIQKYPLDKLTHIIYSFLHLKGDTISFDREDHKTNLQKFVALKQSYPHLKIMISLGGWTGCETCSPVFANAVSRKNFALSVVKLLKEYNADGIDLDWEYPAIEGFPGHAYSVNDKSNFTELLRELHEAFASKYELSFAAGGFTKYLEESIDWAAVMPLVTRVNLMTYDLISGYSTQTGHHTALYSNPNQKESTDNCVQNLLKKGVPAEKLVIGAAFYARVWENVKSEANGRYQAGSFKTAFDFKQFDQKLSADSGWVTYWDKTSHAPYAYNANAALFATYDNEKSLAHKVKYAQKHQLGGIMFWELLGDTYTNGYVDAIYRSIK